MTTPNFLPTLMNKMALTRPATKKQVMMEGNELPLAVCPFPYSPAAVVATAKLQVNWELGAEEIGGGG